METDWRVTVVADAKLAQPKIKALFTTQYPRNAIVHHGRLDPGGHLIKIVSSR